MGDKGQQEIRERIWVEKFDHTGETPVLVETVFRERRLRPGQPPEMITEETKTETS